MENQNNSTVTENIFSYTFMRIWKYISSWTILTEGSRSPPSELWDRRGGSSSSCHRMTFTVLSGWFGFWKYLFLVRDLISLCPLWTLVYFLFFFKLHSSLFSSTILNIHDTHSGFTFCFTKSSTSSIFLGLIFLLFFPLLLSSLAISIYENISKLLFRHFDQSIL